MGSLFFFFSGIGFETAALFAKEGAKVVCADVNEAGVNKSVAKIVALAGAEAAIAFKVDVSKEDQVKALVEKTVNTFGMLDIYILHGSTYSPL